MRAIVYLRQSQDRTGEELGVQRQRQDARKLARLRGWTITGEHVDNDTSASGRRTRPGFEAVLAAVENGDAQAVIAWDMTRLTRNRRDTLRLIEAGERHGVNLAFVRGSDMDLSTPAGRLAADILAGVARHEIDQKSDRQKRAAQQAAEAGKRVGGRRPFGYLDDGVTVDRREAKALARTYDALLSGVSLGRAARDLNAAGFTTPQTTRAGEPSPWTAQNLGTTLRNPRYAGLRAIGRRRERGRKAWEIVGPAEWPGVVAEQTWRAVDAMLNDPGRRHPGSSGVGLLTGVGECGVCGATVHQGGAPRGGDRVYRCRASSGHVARRSAPVDEFVSAVVVERLSRPDARDLLYDHSRPDVAGLRTEVTALNARLAKLAEDYADGTLTAVQLHAGTRRVRARLEEVEAGLADAGRVNVLGPVLAGKDVRATWGALDVDRRRAVITTLARVTIHPPGRGVRTFDPNTVEIDWQTS